MDTNGKSLCHIGCPLKATVSDGNPREIEAYIHHKNGHRIPVSIRSSALTDDDGSIIGGMELFSDISHQKANAMKVEELEKLALLDPLTHLANRTFLEKELVGCFDEQKRYGIPFGIIFLDIDHFKMFNDTYGHDVGNKVLKVVAETLAHNSRPFDVFGRWGGEEFLGIVRNIKESDLKGVAERIRLLISTSYLSHENKKLHITVSIGATMVRSEDTRSDTIRRADDLMYRSKTDGRDCTTVG